MFKHEGPYTRAALRLVREMIPTIIVWMVAFIGWFLWAGDDTAWFVIGSTAITIPYLIEYGRLYKRWLDEVNRLDKGHTPSRRC